MSLTMSFATRAAVEHAASAHGFMLSFVIGGMLIPSWLVFVVLTLVIEEMSYNCSIRDCVRGCGVEPFDIESIYVYLRSKLTELSLGLCIAWAPGGRALSQTSQTSPDCHY